MRTLKDCVSFYKHRNTHLVASLLKLHAAQFKEPEQGDSLCYFSAISLAPPSAAIWMRSGLYELHKGTVIKAAEWRRAMWFLSLPAGVLGALMRSKLLNNQRSRGSY